MSAAKVSSYFLTIAGGISIQWSVSKLAIIFSPSRKVFAYEVEADLIENWYSIRAKFACSAFLSYFFRLAIAFRTRPTPVKVAITTRFSFIPPATAALIINLPAERLQTKTFIRKLRYNLS